MLLFLRNRAERDLDDEIRLHVQLRAQQLREEGMSEEQARTEAGRRFGNRTLLKEITRESWSWTWVEQFVRDVRIALRALRKSPSFTLVAIVSLAVALGANTAVFSFARAILLKTLPVDGARRLVLLRQHNEMFHMENCCFTRRFFDDLRKQDVGFGEAAAVATWDVNLTGQEQTGKLTAELVSGNFFAMLGVHPALGRLIDESDDAAGAAVCVISYRLWRERFGGLADVIGRKVTVDTTPFQIVGVMQRGFAGATMYEQHDLAMPAHLITALLGPSRDSAYLPWLQIIARLRPGVTRAQAEARVNAVGFAIEQSDVLQLQLQPQRDAFRLIDGSQGIDSKKDRLAKPVLLLFGLVGVVLMVACANLTSLLLVRSVERTVEAGVRLALGGSRGALMRSFLVESMVLAVAGAIGGGGLAQALTQFLLKLMGSDGEEIARQVHPDWAVFAFLGIAAILAGVLFGILPAWRASRSDPLRAIRGVDAPRGRSLGLRILVAAQIALSLALLFGAGLFVRTLRNLRAVDLGFRPENVALLRLNLSRTAYSIGRSRTDSGNDGWKQFFENLLDRARQLPGTRAASLAGISPISGAMAMVSINLPAYISPNRLLPTTYVSIVSSGYFRTLGIPLIAGRDFTSDDRASLNSQGVAIVNQEFARKFFNGDALGKTFIYNGEREPVRVVGIAGDTHYQTLREEPKTILYLPVTQWTFPQLATLQVRFTGDPSATIERLRVLVHQIDPRVPIDSITTMDTQIDQALSRERLLAFLSTLTGGIAVTLAAIGLYGVMAFSVARRTREIGIRMAIGAPRSTILRQFLAESAWMAAAGVGLGIPIALGCGRLAASLLYGLSAQDSRSAIAATTILAAIALIAAVIPAWRAARLDPMRALHWE